MMKSLISLALFLSTGLCHAQTWSILTQYLSTPIETTQLKDTKYNYTSDPVLLNYGWQYYYYYNVTGDSTTLPPWSSFYVSYGLNEGMITNNGSTLVPANTRRDLYQIIEFRSGYEQWTDKRGENTPRRDMSYNIGIGVHAIDSPA